MWHAQGKSKLKMHKKVAWEEEHTKVTGSRILRVHLGSQTLPLPITQFENAPPEAPPVNKITSLFETHQRLVFYPTLPPHIINYKEDSPVICNISYMLTTFLISQLF